MELEKQADTSEKIAVPPPSPINYIPLNLRPLKRLKRENRKDFKSNVEEDLNNYNIRLFEVLNLKNQEEAVNLFEKLDVLPGDSELDVLQALQDIKPPKEIITLIDSLSPSPSFEGINFLQSYLKYYLAEYSQLYAKDHGEVTGINFNFNGIPHIQELIQKLIEIGQPHWKGRIYDKTSTCCGYATEEEYENALAENAQDKTRTEEILKNFHLLQANPGIIDLLMVLSERRNKKEMLEFLELLIKKENNASAKKDENTSSISSPEFSPTPTFSPIIYLYNKFIEIKNNMSNRTQKKFKQI